MKNLLHLLKITAEVFLVIAFIIFEEVIWKKLALPVKDYIAELKILESTKVKIMKQETYTTLVIFLVPLIIAELMGLYSGTLLVTGAIVPAIILYIIKIPVAGITFWIFSFTKDKLLTIDWFKTLYDLMIRFLDWIKSTDIYKSVKEKIIKVKKSIKNMMPGGGGFSKEINHIYVGLKNIIKNVKAIDENESTETNDKKESKISEEKDEQKEKHKQYAKEQKEKMKKEDKNIVETIAEANKDKVIKPAESRRDKMENDKNDIPENESRGSAKR